MKYRKLPTEDETCAALAWLVVLIDKASCPYQIVGGLAAKAYGSMRPLVDIDLYVPGKCLEKLSALAGSYLLHPPTYHKDDAWDLTYMSVMYGNQKIEIASSDNAKIFNRLVRKWQVQLIDYQLSNRSQLFDTELFIMPLDQLLAYKSMLGRDVDLEDIKDITGRSM